MGAKFGAGEGCRRVGGGKGGGMEGGREEEIAQPRNRRGGVLERSGGYEAHLRILGFWAMKTQ